MKKEGKMSFLKEERKSPKRSPKPKYSAQNKAQSCFLPHDATCRPQSFPELSTCQLQKKSTIHSVRYHISQSIVPWCHFSHQPDTSVSITSFNPSGWVSINFSQWRNHPSGSFSIILHQLSQVPLVLSLHHASVRGLQPSHPSDSVSHARQKLLDSSAFATCPLDARKGANFPHFLHTNLPV